MAHDFWVERKTRSPKWRLFDKINSKNYEQSEYRITMVDSKLTRSEYTSLSEDMTDHWNGELERKYV